MAYDSTADTLEHIKKVSTNINNFCRDLIGRGNIHDESKLHDPEKPMFDEVTNILSGLQYGSDEYNENLVRLEACLKHHYENNSHHPQHYPNGVDGMTLLDIVEMYCDWKAAVERTKEGDFNKSLEINEKRFNLAPQLVQIFKNTYERV